MEVRDRRANLALFGTALLAWLAVAVIVVTRDPFLEPLAGYAGAVAIGLALALTTMPLFWLVRFARSGGIAYRGSWTRSVRRGLWVGLLASVLVILRIQGAFQPQLALFIIALALAAETSLSMER
jgi:hypothetical protein